MRLFFCKAQGFLKSACLSVKCKDFSNLPVFSFCQYLYIFSVSIFCILIRYAPIFNSRNCFDLRFKINAVVMIV
jgi:hypothetical protein